MNKRIDGIAHALELLQGLDSAHRNLLLEKMAQKDPELVELLKSKLLSIKDLKGISTKMKVDLFKKVSPEDLAITFKIQDQNFVKEFMSDLPSSIRDRMNDVIMKKMPLSDVQKIESKVIALLIDMVDKGEIILGEDDTYV